MERPDPKAHGDQARSARGIPGRLDVTRTFLPPLEEYVDLLRGAWERNWVTNHGPLGLRLEKELAEFLGVRHVLLVANGTLALQIGLRALGRTGDVVTTPFSYVATVSSIAWEGFRPVFVDVDPDTLCLDPVLLERAVTPATAAVLPVHVYGNVCDVERIGAVARRAGVPVLYDAAHAFGCRWGGRSVAARGDLSALSFHATKLFHTVEGGAIATDRDDLADRVRLLRNFGHTAPEAFGGVGINAKMSEVHAAMGLLPRVPGLIESRRRVVAAYDEAFHGCPGLRRPSLRKGLESNAAYYPVLLPTEEARESVVRAMNAENVFPRRYFSPSLTRLPYVESPPMPVADGAAQRVLCLPLHPDLEPARASEVARIVMRALGERGGECR